MSKPPRAPVDWAALEPHYQAGIRPLRSIGIEFGVTAASILKHCNKHGIARDLKARIHFKAAQLVETETANKLQANMPANIAASVRRERDIISANAGVSAHVQIGHRTDISRVRTVVSKLLGELEDVIDRPDAYAIAHLALSDPDEPAIEALREMARLVASLPARVGLVKQLAEALRLLIGMEREAFGLDTAAGTDGRPMVIIKDFCGRGDPDSPNWQAEQREQA